MNPRIPVAVCGSSLTMAGLAASLQANQDVNVIRIPVITAALPQGPGEPAPAVIVFDLAEVAGDLAVALLRECPGLTLVGVEPDSDRLLVLSGHAERVFGVADLIRIIHQKQTFPEEP